MTTWDRGIALHCNRIRGTGQPWTCSGHHVPRSGAEESVDHRDEPGDDDEEQRDCAALQPGFAELDSRGLVPGIRGAATDTAQRGKDVGGRVEPSAMTMR